MNVVSVRVHLADGRYFDNRHHGWDMERCRPDGSLIWESLEDVLHSIEYYYTEGNGACDCNKVLDLSRHAGEVDNWEQPCGDTLETVGIIATMSDGRSIVVYDRKSLGS